MTDLTPERRAELRDYAESMLAHPAEMLALLDELDALAAVAREADQMHAAMLAAEGELLGDSPELPRWERLLLNGLTLPELAKNVADERDQLAAAVERVRALGKRYEADALSEGYGGELWSATAAAIHRTLDGTDA